MMGGSTRRRVGRTLVAAILGLLAYGALIGTCALAMTMAIWYGGSLIIGPALLL
jgi:hypothetical protein